MVTLQEVKDYLLIEDQMDDSTKRDIERMIKVADLYLKGAISSNYNSEDARAKQLALFIIQDLYDRQSFSVNENSTINKLKNDFLMQLRLEGNGADENTNS